MRWLLNLNANVWRRDGSRMCSLRNIGEEESIIYFLCVCPVLGDIRMRYFKERKMSKEKGSNVKSDRGTEVFC